MKLGILVVRPVTQRLNAYDHRRITLSNPPKNGNMSIEERVKTINNPRRPELAGSVRMCFVTALRRAFWRRVWTY